ncbi:MAG: hypothetical protein ACYCXW_21580, partial [Solirubrobacteraceae bacterium]
DEGAAPLAAGLAATLREGFVNRDGLVVLRRYAESADRARGHDDATGVEALANHVHVEDELPDATRDELLTQTWRFAVVLAAALGDAYPDDEFVVIVGVSDSCTVRFHKLRSAERWLAEDIESYQEAVLSLTVGGRAVTRPVQEDSS